MKKIHLISLLVIMFAVSMLSAEEYTDDSGLVWQTDLDDALAIAKENGKPILINFTGSDWCIWCIRLRDEVFSKDAFQEYAKENLNMVFLDFPRSKKQSDEVKAENRRVMNLYGVQGFPTIILLDSEGKLIGKTGYRDGGPEPYVKHLQEFLK